MSFLSNLSDADRGRCFDVLTDVSRIRTHLDLRNWLKGDIQHFLPHDILVAAWGDFQRGDIRHDIVSPLKDVRTAKANAGALVSRMQELFARWSAGQRTPFLTQAERMSGAFSVHPFHDPLDATTPPVCSALVHGLRDLRSEQDCLYVVLSRYAVSEQDSKNAIETLLPHIDTAMRQVPALSSVHAQAGSDGADGKAAQGRPSAQITVSRSPTSNGTLYTDAHMSGRELQIMQWVEMGKTNQEIGAILDISAFTVKNHLQRIFKKLDVYNRAQAVSRFKDSYYAHG